MGVPAAEIGADYELSHERLAVLFAQLGQEDQGAELIAYLADRGTTGAGAIEATLSSIDLETTLKGGGLTDEDLAALRGRMLASSS